MTRFTPTLTPLDDRLAPATLPPGFTEVRVVDGLTAPTGFAVAPDGRVFVAEQGGTLRVVRNGQLLPDAAVTLAVDSAGERGLIGLALDPDFAANGFVYLHHTVPAAGGRPAFNRVSRFTLSGNAVVPGSERVVVDLDPLSAALNHNGGGLGFGADGKLYVGVGENGNSANSQSLTSRLGKLLRLNPDGTIPADNPTAFPGVAGTPTGANRAVWAVGLRNPFSFDVQPGSGRLFINDVGQNAAEEIDLGRAGANYGWPATEGDFDPAAFPAFTRPVAAYRHADLGTSASIAGGAFYDPATPAFPAEYVGDYFFADFIAGFVRRLDPDTGVVTPFASDLAGALPLDLATTAAGDLLVLTRGTAAGEGAIHAIRFAAGGPLGTAGRAAVAVGEGAGGGTVAVFDAGTGRELTRFAPFEEAFRGGVRVATADVTGDRVPDVVVGAGPGGGPRVSVIDGATGGRVRDFFAFEPTFAGGVGVAAVDLDRDGFADLILAAGAGGGPRVRAVSGRTGATLADFFAFERTFTGGARAAAGDVTGDGVPDLAVTAGEGGGPRVAVFDGTSLSPAAEPTRVGGDFFAFEQGLRNGATVAVGDANGDGRADLILGAGPGGGPRVRVLDAATRAPLADFFAGDAADRGGVTVAAVDADADGRAEVAAGPGPGGPPRVGVYRLGVRVRELAAFADTFTGGVFVG